MSADDFSDEVECGSECYYPDKGDYSIGLEDRAPIVSNRAIAKVGSASRDQVANCVYCEAYWVVGRDSLHPIRNHFLSIVGCAHEQDLKSQKSCNSIKCLSSLG